MEDIKTAVNEEDRIFVLFKEKIRIPEGQWFPAGKVDWGIPKNANGDIVLKYYSLNRKASYTSPSMFSEKLPGVHQISIRDFESLIQTNDYFDNLAKQVLTRETTPVTMQSFLLIKNWIESFIEDPQRNTPECTFTMWTQKDSFSFDLDDERPICLPE